MEEEKVKLLEEEPKAAGRGARRGVGDSSLSEELSLEVSSPDTKSGAAVGSVWPVGNVAGCIGTAPSEDDDEALLSVVWLSGSLIWPLGTVGFKCSVLYTWSRPG